MMPAMQDICLSCYMRFLWKSHRFSIKNRTFAPKCQIHVNTEQYEVTLNRKEIYGITNKHRRTAIFAS